MRFTIGRSFKIELHSWHPDSCEMLACLCTATMDETQRQPLEQLTERIQLRCAAAYAFSFFTNQNAIERIDCNIHLSVKTFEMEQTTRYKKQRRASWLVSPILTLFCLFITPFASPNGMQTKRYSIAVKAFTPYPCQIGNRRKHRSLDCPFSVVHSPSDQWHVASDPTNISESKLSSSENDQPIHLELEHPTELSSPLPGKSRRKKDSDGLGGYDPSERIGEGIKVGDPQVKEEEKECSATSILRQLAAINQSGPQKYCILGTRHCSYLHQQIIELL